MNRRHDDPNETMDAPCVPTPPKTLEPPKRVWDNWALHRMAMRRQKEALKREGLCDTAEDLQLLRDLRAMTMLDELEAKGL